MPSCSTNSTVNSQWQVKFTIKWVSYELVSSKINQKQKSFNEFQSATGLPVNTDKGERGVGEEVIWHLGLLFSALASIRWVFLVLVSVKKKKDSSLLFNFKVLKLEKKEEIRGVSAVPEISTFFTLKSRGYIIALLLFQILMVLNVPF